MKEEDILYSNGRFWVCRANNGYEVYKDGITHATRCAIIGWGGKDGFELAKKECDKRAYDAKTIAT